MWDARFNQLMVMKLDKNQDGVVDKEEFMSGFAAALQGTKEEVENRVREYHECALFVRSGRHQQVEMALEVEYQRCGLTPAEHKTAEADKAAVKAAAKAAAQAEAEAFAREEGAKMEEAKMATEKVQMEEALVERERRFKRLLEIFDELDVDAKGVIGKVCLSRVARFEDVEVPTCDPEGGTYRYNRSAQDMWIKARATIKQDMRDNRVLAHGHSKDEALDIADVLMSVPSKHPDLLN